MGLNFCWGQDPKTEHLVIEPVFYRTEDTLVSPNNVKELRKFTYNLATSIKVCILYTVLHLQFFDTVGWVAGRASGL